MSNVEKMHYLKTCVTDEAARLVSNLTVSGDNFTIAWTILVARYENKRFLITSQLDKIFNFKLLKTKSAKGLRTLLTTISEAIAALRALGCEVQRWDPLLLYQLVRLLDLDTCEAWEVTLGPSSNYPTFSQFEEFLISRTRALENLGSASTSVVHKDSASASTGKFRTRTTAHVAVPSNSESSCLLCKSPHLLVKCGRYQAKSVQHRRDFLMKMKRCFNCLGPHLSPKCPSLKRCFKCGKKHHTSIHFNDHTSKNHNDTPATNTWNQVHQHLKRRL